MEELVKMEEYKSRGTSLKASIKRKISSEEYVKKEIKITVYEEEPLTRKSSRTESLPRKTSNLDESIDHDLGGFIRFCSIAFYCAFITAALFMTYILLYVNLG
ncbi:Oidioi.mRNA.OKI2018_I69.chr2.g4310.t1.cds [Oikopleura dioica]|uniref:Oidioi.mRNA.OKI2018_I69.chr2.g4310.t1.cds n=1 Tax=Oikopleura dioica TaxID=34765 RepID=A0ABN7T602_OIKDI|nr:Oidioi.mRNA.OKI2018_I69.chr2.g4310.t1.cds [Oikopleura dioica]